VFRGSCANSVYAVDNSFSLSSLTFNYVGCYSSCSASPGAYYQKAYFYSSPFGDYNPIPYELGQSNYMTPALCMQLAAAFHFPYFAVQNGNLCMGGSNYSSAISLGTSSSCTVPCIGDPTQSCGGSCSNSVYRITSTNYTGISHMGCWLYDPTFVTPVMFPGYSSTTMTVEACALFAYEQGISLFGLTAGNACLLSPSGNEQIARYLGVSTSCDLTCAGNSLADHADLCGYAWGKQLFF